MFTIGPLVKANLIIYAYRKVNSGQDYKIHLLPFRLAAMGGGGNQKVTKYLFSYTLNQVSPRTVSDQRNKNQMKE